MRIFLTKWMARFVRREHISLDAIRDAIARAECGLIDADLGSGLIKQRVARKGQGRSGGYRTIVAFKYAGRAVFLLGFAKSRQANIGPEEIAELRKIGSNWLRISDDEIEEALAENKLEEVSV